MKPPKGYRDTSYPGCERYTSEDGNVMIQRISARSWVVMPRGGENYYVTGKDAAAVRGLQHTRK